MATFDSLQRASFAGFEFPVSECTITGGLREHVHEYPHSPGGAPEKLGRKLYEFRMKGLFYTRFAAYPKLWPETPASLRIIFDGGKSFDLVVPTLGTVTAYCVSHTWTADSKTRNGESAELLFREDQSDLFLVKDLIKITPVAIQTNVDAFDSELEEEGLTPAAIAAAGLPSGITPEGAGLLQSISSAASDVESLITQADIGQDLLLSKADGLSSLCRQADDTIALLNDPARWRLVQSMQRIWSSATSLVKDVEQLTSSIVQVEVPATMSVSDLSRLLYGDNSRAVELMKLNAFENPFAIPRGTIASARKPERKAA